MKRFFGILLPLLVLASGCQNREEREDDRILQYIEDNNLNALSTSEGIYYVVDEEGNGTFPTVNDNVEVHYRGYTLENEQFDSSYERGAPSTFPLTGVIIGWQIGIPLFSEGGSGKLIIPSRYAYGKNPPPGTDVIGKYEILVFDIELITVNP